MPKLKNQNVWGPVLLQVAETLQSYNLNAAEQSDTDLYLEILFGAAHRHSLQNFTERSDPALDHTAALLDRRLSLGWLSGNRTDTHVAFTTSKHLRPTSISNPRGFLLEADKPAGAFWTASLLPSGESAWERLEESEFSQNRRPLMELDFTLRPEEHVATIRGVEDYVKLVEEYPRRITSDRVAIDWELLSRDYVAVTLAACGLARAQNFRSETGVGVAELTGWDSQSTAWLHLPSTSKLRDLSRA